MSEAPSPSPARGRRIRVRGIVQGVGFRPFVHRLAESLGLGGWIRNESGRVEILVEGRDEDLDAFELALRAEAPPLARIDELLSEPAAVSETPGFRVLESVTRAEGRLPVSPDVATCDACAAELRDPADRRYRYPFITCTDCGPRWTVIEAMPYDRERTSMRAFPQCPTCLAEYGDPRDRRYHSETNSCSDCGPRVRLTDATGRETELGDEAILHAARLLREGGILALRGLGGYHLAVDAGNEEAVVRLRERKGRYGKPLAVMVRSATEAAGLGHVSAAEARLLSSRERPVVLLRARPDSGLAPSVAPRLDTVGVMTAYTPLHALLLDAVARPLVMTSGNASELPIATGNEEALRTLGGIADAFLVHDREIVARYDDSVVRFAGEEPILLRRSRGYAPLPVPLPVPAREPILAVGPHLKNTFTLAEGDAAWVSPHVGDLENLETLDAFRDALDRFRALFRIEPRRVARDLHPGYLSTRLAREWADERGLPEPETVQHHHAHVAAVAGEHGMHGPVVGISFDGTGYGEDGRVWGAEILVADLRGYRRVARSRYAPLPGGDLAVRRPWRTAAGFRALAAGEEAAFDAAFEAIPDAELQLVETQTRRGLNAPMASSMGRVFDAAAAVLGLRRTCRYEGQAAMELEALAWSATVPPGEPAPASGPEILNRAAGAPRLPFPERREDGLRVMDPVPLLVEIGRARAAGADPAELAVGFHLAVAERAVTTAADVAREEGLEVVALSGGTFQNAWLAPVVRALLEDRGIRVVSARQLGPNDGSISYGQAVVAAARQQESGR